MTAAGEISGKKFGRLLAVDRIGSRAGHALWLCRCDCGKSTSVIATNLKRGNTTSCGCLAAESLRNRAMDLTGHKYGMLTVIKMRGRRNGRTIADCLCECGTQACLGVHEIRQGNTRSCGCLFLKKVTDHGKYRSPEYSSWQAMIQRCRNPNSPAWPDYGGRGIKVHEEWTGPGGFGRFYTYLGDKPTRRHSLDRINNEGHYEPGNVRWATTHQQAANKRGVVKLLYKGEGHCRAEWARKWGCSPGAIVGHMKKGRSFEWVGDHFTSKSLNFQLPNYVVKGPGMISQELVASLGEAYAGSGEVG